MNDLQKKWIPGDTWLCDCVCGGGGGGGGGGQQAHCNSIIMISVLCWSKFYKHSSMVILGQMLPNISLKLDGREKKVTK